MAVDLAADLWQAWGDGRLCFPQCSACGASQLPPGRVCARCHATDLRLADSDGSATLVSWSVVHRAPSPDFADQVPYTIGLVALPGGALVEARATEAADTSGWSPGLPALLIIGEVNGRAMPVLARVGG